MVTANPDVTRTVAEWVSLHPSVVRVFEKYSIDICREGDKTVIQACRERHIPPHELVQELAEASQPTTCELGSDWEHASIGELCDHIEAVHHRHLRRAFPLLTELLRKLVEVYCPPHQELEQLQHCFSRFRAALEKHLLTETTVLFPAMRSLERGQLPVDSSAQCLPQLINRLEEDHAIVDDELRQIRELTHGYTAPPNTCAAYGAMLDGFWELEWHLHQGMFEESETLFPRALRQQAALLHQ